MHQNALLNVGLFGCTGQMCCEATDCRIKWPGSTSEASKRRTVSVLRGFHLSPRVQKYVLKPCSSFPSDPGGLSGGHFRDATFQYILFQINSDI